MVEKIVCLLEKIQQHLKNELIRSLTNQQEDPYRELNTFFYSHVIDYANPLLWKSTSQDVGKWKNISKGTENLNSFREDVGKWKSVPKDVGI